MILFPDDPNIPWLKHGLSMLQPRFDHGHDILGSRTGKGHTFDIAPVSEEISLQKRSGMARFVERFHSFTCTPARLSTNEMNRTCLSLSSRSWTIRSWQTPVINDRKSPPITRESKDEK